MSLRHPQTVVSVVQGNGSNLEEESLRNPANFVLTGPGAKTITSMWSFSSSLIASVKFQRNPFAPLYTDVNGAGADPAIESTLMIADLLPVLLE